MGRSMSNKACSSLSMGCVLVMCPMVPVKRTETKRTMPQRKIKSPTVDMDLRVKFRVKVAVWQGMHTILLAGRTMDAAPRSFPAK